MNPVIDFARNMSHNIQPVVMLIQPPKCPRNYVEFCYNAGSEVPLICHLEFEPAEAGDSVNDSWPAQMHLDAAYIGAIDVVKALTVKQVRAIEQAALGENA